VLSATAVDESGLLCTNELDADTKRAMAAAARQTILVVDSTKVGARAPIRFGTLDSIDVVVTGGGLVQSQRALLAGAGRLVFADVAVEAAR
jgi:DeoR/GlpR family transcriptional regulator of sugar metabolism